MKRSGLGWVGFVVLWSPAVAELSFALWRSGRCFEYNLNINEKVSHCLTRPWHAGKSCGVASVKRRKNKEFASKLSSCDCCSYNVCVTST